MIIGHHRYNENDLNGYGKVNVSYNDINYAVLY